MIAYVIAMPKKPAATSWSMSFVKPMAKNVIERIAMISATTKKVEEIKEGIEDLDKEKVMKIAKKKGEELKEKASELVELAKEKGTPVLEGVAEDLREKTVSVAKEVVEKLEKK